MRPKTITQTVAGISAPHIVDRNQNSFKLSLQMVVTGTATASAQSTSDLQTDFSDATDYNDNATWFDVLDVTDVTTPVQGNIFFPIQAVRLNSSDITSGSVALTILQAND